jgi:hypothetical protein
MMNVSREGNLSQTVTATTAEDYIFEYEVTRRGMRLMEN